MEIEEDRSKEREIKDNSLLQNYCRRVLSFIACRRFSSYFF